MKSFLYIIYLLESSSVSQSLGSGVQAQACGLASALQLLIIQWIAGIVKLNSSLTYHR
jgi:hypothetical protein